MPSTPNSELTLIRAEPPVPLLLLVTLFHLTTQVEVKSSSLLLAFSARSFFGLFSFASFRRTISLEHERREVSGTRTQLRRSRITSLSLEIETRKVTTTTMVADALVYHPSVAHYLRFVATTRT
jgi:hypothetical protein